MNVINYVRDHYPFGHVSLCNEENIIDTDRGKKKLCFWTDREALDWHIRFRDHMSLHGLFVNQMIATNDGARVIRIENQWLTVHDWIPSQATLAGNEKLWARVLGDIVLACESLEARTVIENESGEAINELIHQLRSLNNKKTGVSLLKRCLPDVNKQMDRVQKLSEKYKMEWPLSPRFDQTKDFKNLYDTLYWDVGQDDPRSIPIQLARFIKEWDRHTSHESTISLLNAFDQHYRLYGSMSDVIYADIIRPEEWIEAVRDVITNSQFDVKMFKKRWDARIHLANILEEWRHNRVKKGASL